jgi:exodeoxyribonuclease V alpha subunit
MSESETINVVIKNVRYCKESFYILETSHGNAKGNLYDCGENAGAEIRGLKYRLTGKWDTDKYGTYFKIEHAEMQSDAIYFFLTKIVKNIGENLAATLIGQFGDDLERIIEEEPEELKNVNGIGEKKLKAICESWEKYKHLRMLTKFIGKFNVSPNLITRIYNKFGDDSIRIIQESPYSLVQVPGVGFQKADEIAMEMGIDPDSIERKIACAEFVIGTEAEMNGHTYITFKYCCEQIKEYIEVDPAPEELLSFFKGDPRFVTDEVNHEDVVGYTVYRDAEANVLAYIEKNREIETGHFTKDDIRLYIEDEESRLGIKLSDKQKWAVFSACTKKLFTLTGYAGTGKSSVAKVFMSILNRVYPDQIVGCAMSGIAARRLNDVSGFPAYTIHSLLEFIGGEGFQRNDENPLDQKVVVLDEAGMVNVRLFNSLVKALPHDAVFIIIGDDAQLPAIGAGNIFADILNKQLTTNIKLDKVFRQSDESVINLFAQEIRQGKVPAGYKKDFDDWSFQDCAPENYFQLSKAAKASGSEEQKKLLRTSVNNTMKEAIKEYIKAQLRKTENILTDFQILTPMRKNTLGTAELNEMCQQLYINPALVPEEEKIQRGRYWFCVGDKVVHVKNENMPYVGGGSNEDGEPNKIRVFNGTLGIIKDIDQEENIVLVEMNTGDTIIYDFVQMGDIIELAYALTVHKAQGSEFKTVMMVLTSSHFIMLDNQWFYTAVTRAKESLCIIGEDFALKRASTNISKRTRNTWLSHTECSPVGDIRKCA